MPVSGCIQAWSRGRVEAMVRTQRHQESAQLNGGVHCCVLGAAGVHSVHENRFHDLVSFSLSMMGSLDMSISFACEKLRLSLLAFRAMLQPVDCPGAAADLVQDL